METLTSDEINPPNPPAYRGAPFDSWGNCIHHPSVRLARPAPDNGGSGDDDYDSSTSWIVERKRCPKCCLNSIIHDTVRKSNLSESFLSGGGGGSRSATKSRYSYTSPGGRSNPAASVSSASFPHAFEEGPHVGHSQVVRSPPPRAFEADRSTASSRGDAGMDSRSVKSGGGSFYSGRGRRDRERDFRSEDGDGSYYSGRPQDPQDVSFRGAHDPSAASFHSSTDRSKPIDESKPMQRQTRRPGNRKQRDLSPESTIGMSTIPSSMDTSACSTITMDTSLYSRTSQHRGRRHTPHGGSNTKRGRPYATDLVPVHENDSRGRDPEEGSHSRASDGRGRRGPRIPTQVNVPEEDKAKDHIVLISNMPKHIGQDQDVVSVSKSRRSREDGSRPSRKKGDEPSSRDDDDRHQGEKRSGRDHIKHSKSKRRSKSLDGYNAPSRHRASSRRLSRSRSPHRRGDASFVSSPSLAASSYYSRSVRSNTSSSRRSVRYDIDPNGYCTHHPDIRLMKPDERDNNYWTVVRKKCPECIREDCPSIMMGGDRSLRSNMSYGTPFDDDVHSVRSIESSKGSSFFLSSLQTPEEIEREEERRRLKRRLAARAYHFPGNTWCEDWFQYLSNTHTVLGLFFHHPLHPLKVQERLVILFGSIAIGLTISNLTYMYFIREGVDADEELFRVNLNWLGLSEAIITKLMITLWTLGSFLHMIFDLGLWHMKACTLCRYGGQIDDRIARWGRVVGLFIVVTAMAAGSYAVLLRASIEYKGEGSEGLQVEESIRNNEFYDIDFGGKRSFRFLLGYLVEFLLAMFVYYPITVTIVFSGVLGCGGRIPILGGRPREIKRERKYEMSKKMPRILKTLNLDEGEMRGADDEKTSDVYSMSYNEDMDENRII
ncbi:hypothetical protein HJC23_013756 [Cyclotella cryptica]|uniref:Uncharacterized protein n=1 Tax=Cyclotella cryptica TaxID=29204 RepID=A0ABD3NNK2_9STRA|eukprot:CCRYP_020370-RA/>CCRYP_020370-RA protein AED:0.32 eAED:0.32 QI:0/-1/0/1/-1/1/1/0/884